LLQEESPLGLGVDGGFFNLSLACKYRGLSLSETRVAFNTYSFGGSGFCIAAAHGVFLIYLCHVVFALETSIAPLFSFAASFCLPDTSSGEYSPKLRPNRLNTLADALNTQQQLERHAEDQHGGAGRNDSERRVSRQILYCLFRGCGEVALLG
jgi:hypothetical protein